MDLYIFSDESGVFDYVHNSVYIMAGLYFTDKREMDSAIRLYKGAERNYRKKEKYRGLAELKATKLEFNDRRNLFSIMERYNRFAFIINMKALDKKKVFESSKSKQRYIDYAFKLGIKKIIERLKATGTILPYDSINLHIAQDEHPTASDGIYKLNDAIYRELHDGTTNFRYLKEFAPILPDNDLSVTVKYFDSECNALVRAADIIANRVLYEMRVNDSIENILSENLCARLFPYDTYA